MISIHYPTRKEAAASLVRLQPVTRSMKQFYVYIMASHSGTLYVGMTSDLLRRIVEHKSGTHSGFTARYGISRLVYFELLPDGNSAIAREKQIKKWRRDKKEALIRSMNPKWLDLSRDWLDGRL